MPALHVAAQGGNVEIVELLLENKADIDTLDQVSFCEWPLTKLCAERAITTDEISADGSQSACTFHVDAQSAVAI